MEASRLLARNVVATQFQSLDKETVRKAKLRILDAIGCAFAGVRAAGSDMLLELVKMWGGAGESTLLSYGGKFPAPNAAMMNSLLTRAFDYEPVEAEGENRSSAAHISGTTIPTALAVAEKQASSGSEMIAALAAGEDLACRLGVASGFDFSLGWCNTGTINLFGATAVSARLLNLNENQVFNAFGIALNQAAGSMAGVFDKTLCFKLPIALSSRNAVFSAELAKRGFTGVNEPFLGPRGFFALYCRNPDTTGLVKDLGQRYYADCVIKPYSACRATHPFIDCALEISRKQKITTGEIEKITVHASPGIISGFCGQPFICGETPQVDGAFSIRFTVATALIRQDVKPEHFEARFMNDPQVLRLIGITELAGDVAPQKMPSASLTVKLKSGEVLEAGTAFPKGDFRKTALSEDEIKAKYRSNMAYSGTISREKSEKALSLIDNLEEVRDIQELMKWLVRD
ncbi:MAG TPA: MmgE/PrpD family protein [Dehalococcoidales bacterium]|nr:MmgE/PrpD family protein [Dehalococcoidales bacterium]